MPLGRTERFMCICALRKYSHICVHALARDHETGGAAIALAARFEPSTCRSGFRLRLARRQVAVSALRACTPARHENGLRPTRIFTKGVADDCPPRNTRGHKQKLAMINIADMTAISHSRHLRITSRTRLRLTSVGPLFDCHLRVRRKVNEQPEAAFREA